MAWFRARRSLICAGGATRYDDNPYNRFSLNFQEVGDLKIMLNGFSEQFEQESLTIQELLDAAQEDDPAVIVEVNGRFVYRRDFSTTPLSDGDTVELIHPSFGG